MNFARDGILVTLIHSCSPGVTEPSETIRPFTSFSGGFFFVVTATSVLALVAAGIRASARTAADAASALLPLPENTGVTIAGAGPQASPPR